MDSKNKIKLALNHQSGPVPLDIGLMPTTGIHVSVMQELRRHYKLEERLPVIIEPYQMLGMVEDDLREAVGIDTKPLWNPWTMFGFKNENFKKWTAPWGQDMLVAQDFVTSETADKVFIYAGGDPNYPPAGEMPRSSFFFDTVIRQAPFDEDDLNPADNLEEFGEVSEEDLLYFSAMSEELKDSKYFVAGNLGSTAIGDIAMVTAPMLKEPKGIRDIQEWYISTVMRQDYLHEVFEKQVDIALRNLERIHQRLGNTIQAAYICGNDFGTQNSPFCSVETFRELYKPHYKRINDWIHQHTEWKTFKHSCGSILPLIPEMIDAGFDIINPVQWTAANMGIETLKSEFGKDVVFWGGGIDTQKTLPYGTPEEVRKEVLKVCEVFSRDGGFVFNPIHNIVAKTPTANLVAMLDALKEFNGE
ncbi:MAG: uroporphyrinogen decarboxylase family protein [Propionivibrio sp.]